MKGKILVVTTPAQNDLTEITTFIARENVSAAERFAAGLTARMEWLALVDFTGSPRGALRPGLRAAFFMSRTIYYTSDDETLTVLRVIHDARHVTSEDFTTEPE